MTRSQHPQWLALGLAFLLLGTGVAPWLAADPAAEKKPATEPPLEAQPGFFDFRISELFEREDLSVHISVKGPLLELVAAASRESDPELANMLGKLQGIEVQVYEIDPATHQRVGSTIDSLAKRLRAEGWQPALTVRVERDHGYVFLRLEGGQPIGLAAMYVSAEDEAVFVNIVGSMDPVAIGRLASRFNLDLQSVTDP